MKINNPNITYQEVWDWIMKDNIAHDNLAYRTCWLENSTWRGFYIDGGLTDYSKTFNPAELNRIFAALKRLAPVNK